MQRELAAARPQRTPQILGVNAAGAESGTATMVQGRTLPWLQDSAEQDAWGLWMVTFRDVVVLDSLNRAAAIYNLTEHDLGVPANYATLRDLILQAE